MKLVVDELKTTLSQTFTLNNEGRSTIAGVRPYIYMHNAPAGTFTIKIKSGGNTLISQTFTSAEIKSNLSTSDNYAHIWKALIFDDPIQLGKGDYELELSTAGYSYSGASYLGWIREHEHITNEVSGTPVSDIENPRAFQFFALKDN